MNYGLSVLFLLACALTSCSTSREAAVDPKSISEVASDTTRPPVPSSFSEFDTTVVVPHPSDSAVIYYRNIFFLQFDDSTSGRTVRSVLQRYQATIVGGTTSPWDRGAYVVRVPDPGDTWEDVQRLAAQMHSEPGVYLAGPRAFRSKLIIRGKYPDVASDTTKPPIPALSYPHDPDFIVPSPTTPGMFYYRRLMAVVFHDSTSGTTVRRFLAKYQATIAGGMPFSGAYILRFNDPGSTIEALTARREQLKAEPGVKYVLLLTSKDAPPALDVR